MHSRDRKPTKASLVPVINRHRTKTLHSRRRHIRHNLDSRTSARVSRQKNSPEAWAPGRFAENRLTNLALVDPIFITELSRSARGLQDVAEQLEGIQSQGQSQSSKRRTQRKGIYAATAHLFYTFGLLASKGIFITGDMPGKIRSEVGGPANACREFGKQLERFVDKAATGRGVTEELSRLVERGTACYSEITRTIEGSETGDQQSRKKAA